MRYAAMLISGGVHDPEVFFVMGVAFGAMLAGGGVLIASLCCVARRADQSMQSLESANLAEEETLG
jgi:hypothetical protein